MIKSLKAVILALLYTTIIIGTFALFHNIAPYLSKTSVVGINQDNLNLPANQDEVAITSGLTVDGKPTDSDDTHDKEDEASKPDSIFKKIIGGIKNTFKKGKGQEEDSEAQSIKVTTDDSGTKDEPTDSKPTDSDETQEPEDAASKPDSIFKKIIGGIKNTFKKGKGQEEDSEAQSIKVTTDDSGTKDEPTDSKPTDSDETQEPEDAASKPDSIFKKIIGGIKNTFKKGKGQEEDSEAQSIKVTTDDSGTKEEPTDSKPTDSDEMKDPEDVVSKPVSIFKKIGGGIKNIFKTGNTKTEDSEAQLQLVDNDDSSVAETDQLKTDTQDEQKDSNLEKDEILKTSEHLDEKNDPSNNDAN